MEAKKRNYGTIDKIVKQLTLDLSAEEEKGDKFLNGLSSVEGLKLMEILALRLSLQNHFPEMLRIVTGNCSTKGIKDTIRMAPELSAEDLEDEMLFIYKALREANDRKKHKR